MQYKKMTPPEVAQALYDGKKMMAKGVSGYCEYDPSCLNPFRYIEGNDNFPMAEIWNVKDWMEYIPRDTLMWVWNTDYKYRRVRCLSHFKDGMAICYYNGCTSTNESDDTPEDSNATLAWDNYEVIKVCK